MSQRNIDDDYELDHYIETIENWRPVIEAAKAWAAVYDAELYPPEAVLLWRTVEALQEVEGG